MSLLVERVLKVGRRRLAGDLARAATPNEVEDLGREADPLKEAVADLTSEKVRRANDSQDHLLFRLTKKSMIADGEGE